MDRRDFFKISVATPVVAQLWPNVVFSQPNAKEYEKRALEFCESLYPVGPSTKGAKAVTGEPYVVIQVGWKSKTYDEDYRSQWTKKEGERYYPWYGGSTPEKGLDSFKEAFSGFTAGNSSKTHKLYWRQKPEMSCRIDIRNKDIQEWYQFYARLLVSDKVPVKLAPDVWTYTENG